MDNPKSRPNIPDMDSDIFITGAGLGGTALALALAHAGHSVTLADALPAADRQEATFDGRSYALALASKHFLDAIGLWNQVASHAQPMLEIKVSDGRPGTGPISPFFLHFDHAEIEEGPMGFMIEDRFLRRALLDAARATPGVTTLNGEQVVAQSSSSSRISVKMASGAQHSAKVLVGADGRHSKTAERAGIRRMVSDYGQTALVAAIAHELPHNAIAHQFFMPSGPLAILPLPGNVSSIVWSEKSIEAKDILTLSDEAFLDHLRPRFGDFLGQISLAGKRYSYPLSLSLANKMIADRLALVGDAAHGVHPIAGQGLNAGLRDVAALTEILTDARRLGEDIGSSLVLQRYQSWRRFDTATLALATDGFNRLFSNDNSILRIIRDVGMGAVQSIPALRRGFIREAAGLTGSVPRLMRGLPL